MSLVLKQLFSILKLLNSDTGTNQIAAGVAAGFILGMTPNFSLQTVLVLLVIFFFRVQLGVALASAFFFAFVAYLLDPIFHSIGASLLTLESLRSVFIQLYNLPILPFTRFNNTITMGAGVVGLALSPFIFLISRVLVVKYRTAIVSRFRNSKFWKAIQATSMYKWYYKLSDYY